MDGLSDLTFVNTFSEGGDGSSLDHIGRAGAIFRKAWVILYIVFLPNKLFRKLPPFRAALTAHNVVSKCLATHKAVWFEDLEWFSLLSLFTRSPVLISTGQAVAHNPSSAQVSRPSYWYCFKSNSCSFLFPEFSNCFNILRITILRLGVVVISRLGHLCSQ